MKTVALTLTLLLAFLVPYAQDSTQVDVISKNIVTVNEDGEKTEVLLIGKKIDIRDDDSDTTTVRIGKKIYKIIENDTTTQITVEKNESWVYNEEEEQPEFDGHWAGFELGVNSFYDENYGNETGASGDFMELQYPKSLEVNINFMEYNIAIKGHHIGLVTGLGWSIRNYMFEKALTIDKVDGIIQPVYPEEEDNLKKSKLTASYLTVPLLLECQIPVNNDSNHIFISAGVIGGINLGSHTKIKLDDSKSKDHGDFNINPFQYSATVRIGLKDISLYGTYSLMPLFKDNKGPELYPFSIGLSMINF